MENKKQEAAKKTAKKPVKKSTEKKPVSKPVSKKEEVKVEEPMANIMEDESKQVNKETLKFIGSAIFWIVFVVLAFIWITDFIKVTREEEPVFCIKNTVHEFEDGTVNECTGLGYKVYTYNRDSFEKGIQFGPFFTKMKGSEK